MELTEFKEKHLKFNELLAQTLNDQENDRMVCYDGAVDITNYFKSKIKIAWLLKEPYDEPDGSGGGWSFGEILPEKNLYEHFKKLSQQTWHPITYISHSIQNNFPKWDDLNWIKNDPSLCDSLRNIAIVNIQKLPSTTYSRTSMGHMSEVFNQNKDLLRDQLEMLSPDVLICGNTMRFYKGLFELEENERRKLGSISYWVKEGKLFIEAYHPAQTMVTRKDYVDDIIEAASRWHSEIGQAQISD